MNKNKIVGISFIILGFFITVNNLIITGAVIGNTLSNFIGIIALVFFIFGCIIIIFYNQKNNQEEIYKILERYENKKISPVEAVASINNIVPIKNVRFKEGFQHTIQGERDSYYIYLRNGKEARELAVLEYLVAVKNNPKEIKKNELHIERGISTKHYFRGFKEFVEIIKKKYSNDLEVMLGIT
ncbi:MAG: hypothetical protein QXX55_01350 [Candidatus Pacearchaeota archaeon]